MSPRSQNRSVSSGSSLNEGGGGVAIRPITNTRDFSAYETWLVRRLDCKMAADRHRAERETVRCGAATTGRIVVARKPG